jgi:uncharacterized protein (TIGR02453 family)
MAASTASPFTPKTLAFLRALKRNNDREWFRARKDDYERHVRGPLIELISRLAVDMKAFAPELVADPKTSLYRIYRDTRFSEDKTPLKTNAAAVFPPRGFPKHEGAGLYFEIAPGWSWIGGGLYMPPSQALYAIREHVATTHPKLHRIVTAPAFENVVGELQGTRLTRVPRGYLKDHKAAHYLQFKQFLGFREFTPEFATSAAFYPELLKTFRAMTPLIRFLNAAIRTGPQPPPLATSHLSRNPHRRPQV